MKNANLKSGPVTQTAPSPAIPVEATDNGLVHVMLLHEDLASALRAKRVVDHLENNLELRQRFVMNLWRFDTIGDAELREQAIEDAKYANIVFLALHGDHELPDAVRIWFRRWLEARDGEPCAMVVSFDANARSSHKAALTLSGLRAVAATAGIDVFPHFGENTSPAKNWNYTGLQPVAANVAAEAATPCV